MAQYTTAHNEGFATVADIARGLGVYSAQVRLWVLEKKLPAPTHSRGKRTYYTTSEAEEIIKTELKKKRK